MVVYDCLAAIASCLTFFRDLSLARSLSLLLYQARAGRRGRAVSLVAESDIGLLHGAERVSGRQLEKCIDVTDDMAIKLLGPVSKAARLTKMKLMDIGFDELVQKSKERKARDRNERERIERALRRMEESDAAAGQK